MCVAAIFFAERNSHNLSDEYVKQIHYVFAIMLLLSEKGRDFLLLGQAQHNDLNNPNNCTIVDTYFRKVIILCSLTVIYEPKFLVKKHI